MNTTDTFTDTFTLLPGRTPLLVSLPHIGTCIPEALRPAYTERALAVEDTDWHLDALYDFARAMGAGLLMPRCARYVIDLNRPPENTPMYPGANNTELCPTRFFTGEPIYRDGCAPGAAEIDHRRATYWRPYHDALSAELARLRAAHGHAVLFDGHSIQAELPWLFEGRLPDLNLGTASGTSCAPSLRAALSDVLADQSAFSQVVDGRFKGGYITRRYGQPAEQVHAVQLEMGWHCYMDDGLVSQPSPHPNPPPLGEGARPDPDAPGLLPPAGGGREGGLRSQPTLDPTRAARVQPVLRALLQTLRDWTPGAAE